MPTPTSTGEFLDLVKKSGILPPAEVDKLAKSDPPLPAVPAKCAAAMVKRNLLTPFQARLLLAGKHRGFRIGAYIVRDQVGHGGMGTVFLAEHETLKRRVAMKVLTGLGQGADKLVIARFMREARSAAALDHPNIVRMFDVSQHGEMHYLVMEYVPGQTLEQMLAARGPLPPGEAAGYVAQAACGLQHAYEKGFVHRDIKPANLMVSTDGTLKILDMGLARSGDDADKLTEMMDRGAVLGTADYVAPETAMGHTADIRSDIYSLGSTAFHILIGRPPFEGNPTQKLIHHQATPVPDLRELRPEIPQEVSDIVIKMLAKKPEDRFQTPAELAAELAQWSEPATAAKAVAGLSATGAGNTPAIQQALSGVVARVNRPDSGVIATRPGGASTGRLNPAPGDTPHPSSEKTTKTLVGKTAPTVENPLPRKAVAQSSAKIRRDDPADEADELTPASSSRLPGAGASGKTTKSGKVAGAKASKDGPNLVLWGIIGGVALLAGGTGVAILLMAEPDVKPIPGLKTDGTGGGPALAPPDAAAKAQPLPVAPADAGDPTLAGGGYVEPKDVKTAVAKAQAAAYAENWAEAAAYCAAAIRFEPENHTHWRNRAVTLARSNPQGYALFRGDFLAKFADTPDNASAERTAKGCLLLPAPPDDVAAAHKLAQRAVSRSQPTNASRPYFEFALGLAEYRAGRDQLALDRLAPIKLDPKSWGLAVPVKSVQAMAAFKLGKTAEAKDFLRSARGTFESKAPAGVAASTSSWPDWVTAWLLLNEADSLVNAPAAATVAPAAPPGPAAAPVYRFEVPAGVAFSVRVSEENRDGWKRPPNLPGSLWFFRNPEVPAEYSAAEHDGKVGLGVTELKAPLTTQLGFNIEDTKAPLVEDRDYVAEVLYRTTGTATGKVLVRDAKYKTVATVDLPGTGGAWQKASVAFHRGTAVLHACVESGTVGEGNTVWVATLEVRPAK